MKNWKTTNGYEIVHVLSGRSNAYLIKKDKLFILIDTGKTSAYGKLTRNIDSLGLSIQKITHLVLTHTHYDHCQSAKKIKDNSSCEITVSCNAQNWIKTGYTKLPKGTTILTSPISRLGQWIGKSRFGYHVFEPDIFIHGDYDLDSKNTINKINIIETPGHSEDSISILVDNEIAIVGDTLFGVFKNSIFPPYADNTNNMIRSWNKLLNSGCKVFLPGHGNEITRARLKKHYESYTRKYK